MDCESAPLDAADAGNNEENHGDNGKLSVTCARPVTHTRWRVARGDNNAEVAQCAANIRWTSATMMAYQVTFANLLAIGA